MPEKKNNNDLDFGDLENEFFSSSGFSGWEEEPEPEEAAEEASPAEEADAPTEAPLEQQVSDFSSGEQGFFADEPGAEELPPSTLESDEPEDADEEEDDEENFAAADDFVDTPPDQTMILRRSQPPPAEGNDAAESSDAASEEAAFAEETDAPTEELSKSEHSTEGGDAPAEEGGDGDPQAVADAVDSEPDAVSDDTAEASDVPAVQDEQDETAVSVARYIPASSTEEQWSEAVALLLLEADLVDGNARAALQAEAAMICFAHLQDWEQAGALFADAIKAGIHAPEVLKASGDVAASRGDLDALREVLLLRASVGDGALSAEALQDAVLVERKQSRGGDQDLAPLIAHLNRSLELVPGDWFALRLLRELEQRQSNWAGLVDVLSRMASLASGERAARLLVEQGRIWEDELGNTEEAEQRYAEALAMSPGLTEAFLAVERCAQLQGNNVRLAALYKEEAERLQSGPDAAFWMAGAARCAAREPEQVDETVALYQSAIALAAPSDQALRHEAQRFYMRHAKWDELAVSLEEEATHLEGQEKAYALFRLGRALEAHFQDADGALDAYLQAATADHAARPAVEAVSRILTEQGRWERLRDFLTTMLEQAEDPNHAVAGHYRLGELHEGPLNDQPGALKHYESILNIAQGYLPALEGLERVCTRLSDWGRLASVYEQRAALAADPAGTALQLHRAATIHDIHLGQQDQARELYRQALEQVPDFPASLDAYLRILEAEDNWPLLAGTLAQAAQASADGNEVVSLAYRAARVYTERVPDSQQEAIACLERCLNLQPGFLPAIALLREISERTGDWAQVYTLHQREADSADEPARRHWRMLAAAEAIERADVGSPTDVLEAILAEDQAHLAAIVALEEQALQGGDLNSLLAVYQRLMEHVTDDGVRSRIGARVAAIARDSGDTVLAVRAIDEVSASGGDRPLLALARVAEALNHWEKARDVLIGTEGTLLEQARLLESHGGEAALCVEAWRAVLDADPENTDAAAGLERSLSRLGSREGMAEAHALLAEHLPDVPIQCFHALLAGHLHEATGQPEQAIVYYQKAFQMRKQSGKAFDALRRLYIQQQDAVALRALFEELPNATPQSLARALEQAGAAGAAADIYAEQLAANPDNTLLIVRLEQALHAAGRWEALFDLLCQALTVYDNAASRARVESKRRWVLSEKLSDTEQAAQFYEQLYAENPEDPEVLEALAQIASAHGEVDKAIGYLGSLAEAASSGEEIARYQRRIAEVYANNSNEDAAKSAYMTALESHPGDMASLAALKEMSRAQQDWAALVSLLQKETEVVGSPDNVEIYREIATLYVTQLDELEAAKAALSNVLEAQPSDVSALSQTVDICRSLADWQGLIQYGRVLVQLLEKSERSVLLNELGHVYLEKLYNESEALRFLEAALYCEPMSEEAAATLERMYAARGAVDQVIAVLRQRAAQADDPKQSVELLLKAAEKRLDNSHDRSSAADLFAEVLAIEPSNIQAMEYQSEHLYRSGEMAEAVSLFEQLEAHQSERDIEDDFDVRIEVAMFFFRFADALSRIERVDEAVGRYEKALDCNSSHLPSLEAVGPLYMAAERWDDAGRVYRQVLQLTGGQGNPDRLCRTYTSLGIIEHRLGKLDKAKKRFNRARELKPTDIGALKGMADLMFDREDWTNLLTVYNHIIYHAQEPKEVVQAYLTKGYILDTRLSLPDKAEQHYRKSLDFNPGLSSAHLRLAELALRSQDWPQAASTAEQGLSIGDASADIVGGLHLVKAIAHRASEDEVVAAQCYHEALQASPALAEFLDRSMGTVSQLHEGLRRLLLLRP